MDYAHSMLCLDDTKVMQAAVKGGHIALVTPRQAPNEVPLTTLPIIPVHLSGLGARQLLLTLDSGANASFLFRSLLKCVMGICILSPDLRLRCFRSTCSFPPASVSGGGREKERQSLLRHVIPPFCLLRCLTFKVI
jgi:hypothetical protein